MASAPKVKAEPTIKPDPEDASASPAGLSDDDIYEDAGDLEFYNIEENPMAGNVYLTHVPKYLYDAWAHLDDDADIQIGTIRQWNETLPNGQVKQRIALLLDHKSPEHQMIPKEYNLDVKDMQLKNSFLFSEQDLPGFKTRAQGANSNIPAHLRRSQEKPKEKPQEEGGSGHGAGGAGGGGRGGRKGRYQPYYRKAIPKKTVLAGRFAHELNCQPAQNAETKHILAMRANDALKPRATTQLAGGRGVPKNAIQAGTHKPKETFGSFVRPLPDAKKEKKKKQEDRALRMSEHELRDAIFLAYKEFSYWSMKAFKQRLNQPEAWLRENLEQLAVLHKAGAFANHWELKPEYKQGLQSVEGAAPDVAPEESDSDGDEEMEDVAI